MQKNDALWIAESLAEFGDTNKIADALMAAFKDYEAYIWGVQDVIHVADGLEVELSLDEAREIVAEIVDDQICSPNYGISDSIIEAKVERLAEERGDFDKQDEDEEEGAAHVE
jgi:hypothetical protein